MVTTEVEVQACMYAFIWLGFFHRTQEYELKYFLKKEKEVGLHRKVGKVGIAVQ